MVWEHDHSSLLDLSGQVAFITGASRGIGRAVAGVLGRAGARLALMARTPEPLAATADSLRRAHTQSAGHGGNEDPVMALPGDVANEEQVMEAVSQIEGRWGRLDILVNNAALIKAGSYDTIVRSEWDDLLAANLTGAYLCCRGAAPIMRRRGYGRIVNISSITAQTGGVSGGIHYAASKGGLLSLTKTLARDLAPFGITVNAIAPGQIETDPGLLTPDARRHVLSLIPLGRLGDPLDIAYGVLFLVSPMAAYITGTTLDINGGLLKR